MPNPRVCNRIADPAARRRCLKYQGEFAQPGKPGKPQRKRSARGRKPSVMSGGGGFGGGSY